jgi:anti-sigma factor RsiW
MSNHLSEEAFDDLLIGLGSIEQARHLSRCAACRAKVEQFREDVGLFNQASMQWSEAQPTRALCPAVTPPSRFHMPIGLLGSALATILIAAVVVPVWRHERAPNLTNRPAQDSAAQIAEDNMLMQEVNAAISPQEQSPIEAYHITEGPAAHSMARPK